MAFPKSYWDDKNHRLTAINDTETEGYCDICQERRPVDDVLEDGPCLFGKDA